MRKIAHSMSRKSILIKLFSIAVKLTTLFNDNSGEVDLDKYFGEISTQTTDTHIIKKRRQKADGRVFVVHSFFDRLATKTAEDKLRSLIAMEAENEIRETI